MWKTRFDVNRHRSIDCSSTLIRQQIPSETSPIVTRVREDSPNGFSRSSSSSSQSNLEILTEEDENEDEQQTKTNSLTINRPHSSHSFSKHQSALPTIVESQDHETNLEQTTTTNSSEKLRQFKIEKRIYELLQQQRDVRQDKVRQYFFNFASTHCQNRKRIVS